MGAAKKLIDKKVLRDLVPINALSATHIDEISRKAVIEEIRSGSYVFKAGDRDNQTVYLLEGLLEFVDDGRTVVDAVVAGSEQARHPLAHKQPRHLGARAKGKVSVARVDSSLLDVLLTWDESAGYDVVEIDTQDGGDWMTRMLQSEAFLRLPPANIHQLLMRLEAVSAAAGDVILRQGDEGDYFYIVKAGRLAVTRKASPRSKEVLLAELGEGACFGEEALVSGTKRNASVMMVTDGSLMRLSQDNFNELLRAPLVHEVDYDKAQELAAGGARWLDVRLPGEFENQAVRDSLNLPLSALREQCAELDKNTDYIVCCDTGRRSAAGAFVLSQRGFSVYTLKNGLREVPAESLSSPDASARDGSIHDADAPPPDAEGGSNGGLHEDSPDREHAGEPDSELIDKLASAESERQSLQQEVARLQASLVDLEAQLTQLSGGAAQQSQSLQSQLAEAQRQLNEEREQLNAGLQQRDKQLHALEEELNRLRADYQQLGQRTSAVAGERDAMSRDLHKAQGELKTVKEQIDNHADKHEAAAQALQQALDERQQALAAGQIEADNLRQRLDEAAQQRAELEDQLAAAAALAQSAQAQRSQLETQAQDSGQRQEQIESDLQNANLRLEELQETLRQQQHRDQEQQAEHARLQQELAQAGAREQALQERLQELGEHEQERGDQWQQQFAEATARIAALEDELAAAVALTEERAAQTGALQEQLAALAKEHQSDLHSTRQATSRAQTETENLKREHSRVMESLRQAERKLEQERHDHDSDLYRLRKQLKEAAGGADSNLAAELEAAQIKLHEEFRAREELEMKLGERSSHLDDARAEADRLELQLRQAQDSARQAEEQLLEANQTANQEMSTRLDAEEQARQKLREELAEALDERNRAQEQLTVERQELEELRLAVERAQSASAAHDAGAEQLQALREERDAARQRERQLEQERDAARQRQQELEQERDAAQDQQLHSQQALDQLRAEAEVTRGLVDMQAGGAGADSALREQLAQAQQNVDVAVRLRSQTEEKNLRLEAEVTRLQSALTAAETVGVSVADIPSLDNDPPQTAGATSAEYARNRPDDVSPDEAGTEHQAEYDREAAVQTFSPPAVAASGGFGRLLLGIVLGAAVAGGGTWWLMAPGAKGQHSGAPSSATQRSSAPTASAGADKRVPLPSPGLPEAGQQASVQRAPPNMDAERDTSAMHLPGFVKGGSSLSNPPTVSPANTASANDAAAPAKTERAATAGESAPPVARKAQSLRLFSQPLADGGRAPTLVEFQAAAFAMGSGASSANFDERPRHRVELPRFAISTHEITFAEYDRFARASGRSLPNDNGWGRGERPVINVSWQDAQAYTRWLSEQTGGRYRLPSEAQWEFAARAGTDTRFAWGNTVGVAQANCFDCGTEWSARMTAPTGSFAANAFRLYDMAGNVMEWVEDCFQADYSGAPADGSAVGDGDCSRRVVRGGAYNSPSASIRSTSRDARETGTRLDNLGFRVVKE